MTDQKFTDDELQRCIECCIKGKVWGDCKKLNCPAIRKQGCHFYLRTDDDYENTIYIEILKDALALINRQKAEIERLNAVHADMTESLRLAAEANKDMQAEIEAQEEEYADLLGQRNAVEMMLDISRAEAIKEFADKVIDLIYGADDINAVSEWQIRNLVKEMTEEAEL